MKMQLVNDLIRTLAMAGILLPAVSYGDLPPTDNHWAVFNEAIAALDDNNRRNWAYTETSFDEDGEFVGRFNPSQPAGENWTLIFVDGRTPTREESLEYTADKGDDGLPGSHNDGRDGVNDIVEPGSLTLLEETADYWLFSFIPVEDEDDEGFFEHIDATLKIIKDGPYLEYIDMRSARPFKLQFGIKIKKFLTRLQFGPAAIGGPIAPQSINIDISIRAFLVKSIDETVMINYSDYEYVGD
jgi:hypothetical protein